VSDGNNSHHCANSTVAEGAIELTPLLLDGFILHVAIEHRLMARGNSGLHAAPVAARPQIRASDCTSTGRAPGASAPDRDPRRLGRARSRNGDFGWDNEFEAQEVEVPAFVIDAYKVRNGEFLRFVQEGGYQQRTLWADMDWEWREARGVAHPMFWTRQGDQCFYQTMFAEVPLPTDWPVYVSHAEASAYARWANRALPSEAKFHRAAYGTPSGLERAYPWGHEPPGARHGNFDFHRWDPTPVGAHPEGGSAFGVADLVGNGWEWTSTPFAPLPGFEPFSFYPGYSAGFFDDLHYVAKGGSPRTAACLLRRMFSELVPAALPVRVCRLPLGRELTASKEDSC
jgi:formylglycine-generating enzyme required for sulfatase activity